MVNQEQRTLNNVYYAKCGYTQESGKGQHYSVYLALKQLDSVTFAAGLEIYKLDYELFEERRQLVKVMSLYLEGVSGYRETLHAALKIVLSKLERNASICVKGTQLDTLSKYFYKDEELINAIHANNMFLSFRHIKGTMRVELACLLQDAAERKSSVIANI